MNSIFVWTLGDIIGLALLAVFVVAALVVLVMDKIDKWKKLK